LARVALALLLVTMSLGSNLIVLIGTILGERLLYLPSATVCLLAGSVLLERGWSARRRGVAGALAVWGTALLVLLLLYLPCWRDNTALSAYGIRRAPQSANLQLGYALELRDHGKLAPALEHVDEAARLDPTNLKIGAWRAVILAEAGRPEGLRELERVHVVDAGLDLVNQELARLLTARGETVRAERVLREGIRLAPKSLVNWLALTEWLAKQGRRAEAQQLLKSLEPALTSEQRDTARRWLAGPTEGAVTTPTLKMR
jgi:tetratricopeptide (TPR) repeat protein